MWGCNSTALFFFLAEEAASQTVQLHHRGQRGPSAVNSSNLHRRSPGESVCVLISVCVCVCVIGNTHDVNGRSLRSNTRRPNIHVQTRLAWLLLQKLSLSPQIGAAVGSGWWGWRFNLIGCCSAESLWWGQGLVTHWPCQVLGLCWVRRFYELTLKLFTELKRCLKR